MVHAAFEAASRQETASEEHTAPPPPNSTNPADWITADDYPLHALRNGEEDIVALRWRVGPEGRVHDCTVTASSGHASLDQAACRAIVRSGRYPPAAPGDPQLTVTRRVIWKIPK